MQLPGDSSAWNENKPHQPTSIDERIPQKVIRSSHQRPAHRSPGYQFQRWIGTFKIISPLQKLSNYY
jgi:hypothetical protein